jgi:hypothetical protein
MRLHDGRKFDAPSDADVEACFASLSDPGDFVVLSDESLGEVRAAGPHDGNFLLQCELRRTDGSFAGERDGVGAAEASSIFREFLAGRTHWSGRFVGREPPLPQPLKVVVWLVGAGAVAALLWLVSR